MTERIPTDKEKYEDLINNRFHINRRAIADRIENYTPETCDDISWSDGAVMYAEEQGWDGYGDELAAWHNFVSSLYQAHQLTAYFNGMEPTFDDSGYLINKENFEV